MRTLAIGDIHGCHVALTTLLQFVKPTPEDRLVFVGDYIDRGPASREVIDTLLSLDKIGLAVFLRGNHEEMMLDARETFLKADIWQGNGGLETLLSYSADPRGDWEATIPEAHWKFLEQTRRFFETETQIFVHGCMDPQLDPAEQPDELLLWEKFDQIHPHKSGKKIICGHTPQHSGLVNDIGFAACIDTGPAGGGWLTCLDVNSGIYWQANEKGETRENRP